MRPLESIERDAAEATPGPWEPAFNRKSLDWLVVAIAEDGTPSRIRTDDRNVAFIAAARTDVPDLCAEVKRLRALLLRADPVLAALGLIEDEGIFELLDEQERLRAEIAKLKGEP